MTSGTWAEILGNNIPPTEQPSSLFSHIEKGLKKSTHRTAIRCMHQSRTHLSELLQAGLLAKNDEFQNLQDAEHDPDCLTMTYNQVHHAALVLVAGMMANGARHGSTILTLIPNGAEYAIFLWACVIMRLTFTALDSGALEPSGKLELANLMKIMNADLVIVPDSSGARAVSAVIKDLGIERQLLLISLKDDSLPQGWKSLRSIVTEAPAHPLNEESVLERARNDDPNRIHSVLFTSGTSGGHPKGCPQRVGSMCHSLHAQSWLINSRNCGRVLQQAHNSRAISLLVTLQTWGEGGAVVLASSKSFSIEHTLEAILRHGVTFIVLSPTMVYGLAEALSTLPGGCNDIITSVTTVHVGGYAVTRDVLTKAAALFPCARVCISQGMTEGTGFFEWPFVRSSQLSQIPHFAEICPVGEVASGTSLRICEPGSRSVLRKGEPGELHVCCKSVIDGYLGGVESSSFYEDENGHWFITGDMAMIDESNLIYLLGRTKESIKRGGATVIPAVLESCIEKYTKVQATVVPVPHESLRHEPFAVLSNFSDRSKEQIKSHVLYALGKDYVPADLFSLQQIGLERAPVNATQKIMKSEVLKALMAWLNDING